MPLGLSTGVKEDVIHSKVTEPLPLFNLKQRRNNSATAIEGIWTWWVTWDLLFSEVENESRERGLPSEWSGH